MGLFLYKNVFFSVLSAFLFMFVVVFPFSSCFFFSLFSQWNTKISGTRDVQIQI